MVMAEMASRLRRRSPIAPLLALAFLSLPTLAHASGAITSITPPCAATGSDVAITGRGFGAPTCNRIENNGPGIQLLDQQPGDSFIPTITAHSNTILGNTVGVDNETPGLQSATGNWWGCAAGPGNPGCDTVAGNVDASGPLSVPPRARHTFLRRTS